MRRRKVFVSQISPSGTDLAWTRAFTEKLRDSGLDVFEYLRNDDDPSLETVEHELRTTDSIVMLMEASSLNSGLFAFEAGVAISGEKDLVAVVPAGLDPPLLRLAPNYRRVVAKTSPGITAEAVLVELRQPQLA
jgi:hypothetical protein